MKKPRPKIKKLVFDINPEQGSMFLTNSAPKGYIVQSIVRDGTKATVTYEKVQKTNFV